MGVYKNLTPLLQCIDATAAIKNKRRFGYATPEEEFIRSDSCDIMKIASRWHITIERVRKVAVKQDWYSQRQRYQQTIKMMEDKIIKSDVAAMKAQMVVDGFEAWLAVRSGLMEAAEKGYSDEISPTGKQWKREFGPKDYLDVAKGLDLVSKNIRNYVDDVEGKDEEEVDMIVPLRVTKIVYNETPDPNALPEGEVEGEIVD